MNIALLEREQRKYCRKHPAPFLDLAGLNQAVVVPCYDENAAIEETLHAVTAAAGSCDVAVILVINYPAGQSAEASLKLRNRIAAGEFAFVPHLFDLWAPELTGGVGQARKLGMDSFIASLAPEQLATAKIFSLDADCTIAPDYFTVLNAKFASDAPIMGVIPGVRHQTGATPELEQAIRRYEAYLDRYAQKMHEAGSPYSFHTIGSAFAVMAVGYWRAGGMKIKNAGEDFYFLQELAKVGKVVEIPEKLVFPQARESHRVPFGTGPALSSLLRGEELPEVPDAAFAELQKLLAAVPQLTTESEKFWSALTPQAQKFLVEEKFLQVWPKIAQNTPPNPAAWQAAFHRWFDGLKSLRFLHYCAKSPSLF